MTAKKRLKTGFTTGTAAAAATKGALLLLVEKKIPLKVKIKFLTGDYIDIPVNTCVQKKTDQAVCTVIKDAGDDPDITHKAVIGAKVTILDKKHDKVEARITGSRGVGVVTKKGLEIEPGNFAINSGPLEMISQAASEVLEKNGKNFLVSIKIFVPDGEKLATKTLNKRLGILGGISILGTTGIVRPMSHDAYIATIRSAISVAKATGAEKVVLTTGRRSERYAQLFFDNLPDEAFIQIGDFFQKSLDFAAEKGFRHITLAVFFGKAIKMANKNSNTHASKSSLTMANLSIWAYEVTRDEKFAKMLLSAHTARHAFELINDKYPEIISYVGMLMIKSAKEFTHFFVDVQSIIFDYSGRVVFNSDRY